MTSPASRAARAITIVPQTGISDEYTSILLNTVHDGGGRFPQKAPAGRSGLGFGSASGRGLSKPHKKGRICALPKKRYLIHFKAMALFCQDNSRPTEKKPDREASGPGLGGRPPPAGRTGPQPSGRTGRESSPSIQLRTSTTRYRVLVSRMTTRSIPALMICRRHMAQEVELGISAPSAGLTQAI